MSRSDPHYIVAIGASAGGMEDIYVFFDNTFIDGVSYIIVQHLSADFKSQMLELLAKHSKLMIKEAGNGMPVEPNHIYLIPNDQFMTIKNGTLYLRPKGKSKGPHLTINVFFKSLAANSAKEAIGVILSGLGADGTDGIKDIKRAGGLVIVRNPETTEYKDMPSNAIASGLVDFILEPALMPNNIRHHVQYAKTQLAEDAEETKAITPIIELISEQLPLDFSEYKQTTILRRIKRRAAQHDIATLKKYYEFLKKNPEDIAELAKDFLISVTSFFRDKEAFAVIENQVLPNILSQLRPDEELKIWVAGCATGEEAYSIAMLVCEQLAARHKTMEVKIFATDIDEEALGFASKGCYQAAATKNLSPERLDAHFVMEENGYRIKTLIRKMMIFAKHDLVQNPPYCNMQLISCRNLLIYMNPALQKKAFGTLFFGLKKNGYLFLGPSENPLPIMKNLGVINAKWRVFKKLENSVTTARVNTFLLPQLQAIKQSPLVQPMQAISPITDSALSESLHASLAQEFDYLLICVDANNEVVKAYGDTNKYLLQKHFTSNLIELLPRPLAVAFNTLSKEVYSKYEKMSVKGVNIKKNKKLIRVSLEVSPIVLSKNMPALLKVIIREEKDTAPVQLADGKQYNEKLYLDQYVLNLEEELRELKGQLHTAYEKLDAVSENMQSFSEELLSANEELQSTNEEMQSVNEELNTVNADYQVKNKELSELNDDLNNYFRSNVNGQLVVDNEMILLKFSPGAVKLINLLDADIGRPLSNISTNIKFPAILPDIETVLKKGVILTKEIESNDGKWYQLMTMPYVRQADNARTGAILTFIDITALKNTQDELDRKNKNLRRINTDLDHFVHLASHDLLAPLSNIEASISIMNDIALNDTNLVEFINIINISIKKFSDLIKVISNIAKIERATNVLEEVNLNDLLDDVEWSLANKIQASDAVIFRKLEITHMRFSKNSLRSILYNLISNGIKFRGEATPVIQVHTYLKDKNVLLSVQDNGMGIAKEEIHKIFDMYGRLHEDIEGSGVGLYMIKKIINAFGGRIKVESKLGKGSKFTVIFGGGL